MNKDIKKEWVDVLRSGEYEQGTAYLKRDGKYCCLGVLCEIYKSKTGNGKWEETTSLSNYKIERFVDGDNRDVSGISGTVQEWSGLNDTLGELPNGENLARLNDDGMSFKEIADVIEKQL